MLTSLCDAGYRVSLETSGALDLSAVDPRVTRVMDLITPGSGEVERNLYSDIQHLPPPDQIKFVLCDRTDYDWALGILDRFRLAEHGEVLFTTAAGELEATQLADWILADKVQVRRKIQLHKYLWGDVPGC